ncbi:MAG: glycosyltransferase family 4 protein [Bacteroidetes bacterium]|nr:glycosyltransferase family 4 protein [Bacteroidota bacterium]
MPKILIGVSSSFCANFLKGQIAFLAANGFKVVIVSAPGEEISMLAKKENAELITIPFTKRISPVTDFFQLIRIVRILRREKPDIVNAGNPKSGFLIMIACFLTGFKHTVFTMHGLLSDNQKGLLRSIITLTEKISCRIPEKVIVVSHSLREHAIQRKIINAVKAIVIAKGSSNGIDLSEFSKSLDLTEQVLEMKERFGLTDKNIVVGYIGRLSKDKGIDILFEAFNILVAKYPVLRLVIAGPLIPEHPFSARYLDQLYHDEKVIYLGKLLDVRPVYELMDMLVLPSYREGFPNVLIEAAAMEVPVIATNIAGCRDAVMQNVSGELFEKGNVTQLTSAIGKLIDSPDLRKNYGQSGRVFVEKNFANERIWKGQLELYSSLLQ